MYTLYAVFWKKKLKLFTDEDGCCKVCYKKFPTATGLRVHLSTHFANKTINCEICPKKFTTENNLKRHVTNVHGDKLFECNICEKKSFVSQEKLQAHLMKHLRRDTKQSQNESNDSKPSATITKPVPELISMPMQESNNKSMNISHLSKSVFHVQNWMKRE